jgi:hypothetical protein
MIDWTITPVGTPRILRQWSGRVPTMGVFLAFDGEWHLSHAFHLERVFALSASLSLSEYVTMAFAYPERIEIGQITVRKR